MNEVKRIILFHAGALGDLICTEPSVRAIREKWPFAEIHAVGNMPGLVLLKEAGTIDHALSLDAPGMHLLFRSEALSQVMKDSLGGYDLAVTWIRAQSITDHLSCLGVRVAALRDRFPPSSGSGHIVDFMAKPLKELGIEKVPEYPRLSVTEAVLEKSPSFSGILVHPGSGSEKKNWTTAGFRDAAREIAKKSGLPLGIIKGPADEKAAGQLMNELGNEAEFFEDLSTLRLAGLLSRARLLLGNDSGVSHLAGALGTPVVSVFGPTDPEVWGVRQPWARNVAAGTECSPCTRELMWKCSDRECLSSLSPDKVADQALQLLGGSG